MTGMHVLAVVAAAVAVNHCPPASIGPGSVHRGGTTGATCLLSAFRDGCRGSYVLSAYGVDTIHSETFRLRRRNGACTVVVTESFRVVPQKPHLTLERTCTKLRRTAKEVLAEGCSGGEPHTVSLTSLTT
jgi:hypothetical protein